MAGIELLIDGFDRIQQLVHGAVEGLSDEQLAYRVDGGANTIGWLVWHLTRIQDDHVAGVAQTGQVWTDDGWADRFGLPFDATATGYGQDSDDVGAVRVSAQLLTGYHDAVHDRAGAYLHGLGDPDLDQVVDERWDPPVTLGVRLVSVLGDALEHVGQAAFIRGVMERSAGS